MVEIVMLRKFEGSYKVSVIVLHHCCESGWRILVAQNEKGFQFHHSLQIFGNRQKVGSQELAGLYQGGGGGGAMKSI